MVRLIAEGYELLDPGNYLLEIIEAESVNVYQPQVRLKLRVAAGEHEGFVFNDWPNRGSEGGVKMGTKAWDIFEACLNRRLSVNDELDTADLIGKKFEARVLVRRNGKRNHTEHGSIAPYRSEKDEPESREPSDLDAEDFFDQDS
ncbi:MAG: hypothetical protein LC740_06080 [Actinobacteria bacterium]|nr:hypothetical protein [Actinomycetota bacterium]